MNNKNPQPIKLDIGFEHSKIVNYQFTKDCLVLILECWNLVIVEIKFKGFAAMFSINNCEIYGFYEIFESSLLDLVLKRFYEIIPTAHLYHIFKFVNEDEETVLEVVCENIEISKKE